MGRTTIVENLANGELSHPERSRARLNKGLLESANASPASVKILIVSSRGIRNVPMDVGMPDCAHDGAGSLGVPGVLGCHFEEDWLVVVSHRLCLCLSGAYCERRGCRRPVGRKYAVGWGAFRDNGCHGRERQKPGAGELS